MDVGIDRTFTIANHAADIIKRRRRETIAHSSRTAYQPIDSDPYYHYPSNPPFPSHPDDKHTRTDQLDNYSISPQAQGNPSSPKSRPPKGKSIWTKETSQDVSPSDVSTSPRTGRRSTMIPTSSQDDLSVTSVISRRSSQPERSSIISPRRTSANAGIAAIDQRKMSITSKKPFAHENPQSSSQNIPSGRSYDGPTYPIMTSKGMTYLGAPPMESIVAAKNIFAEPNSAVIANTQKALNIIQNLNSIQSDLYPPIRVAIEKLLQHLKIQYLRAPSRFVQRLFGLPQSKPATIEEFHITKSTRERDISQGNFSSNMSKGPSKGPAKGLVITTFTASDKQIQDAQDLLQNKRYVTYEMFANMIHNVRPEQEPHTIKELFNLLAERRECVQVNPLIASIGAMKSATSLSGKYMMILDMWAFLTLLKTVAEESRCIYNLKASKLQNILDYWDKTDTNCDRRRPFAINEGYSGGGGPSSDSISPQKSSFSLTESSRRSRLDDMASGGVGGTDLVSSIDNIGTKVLSGEDNNKKHHRKSFLCPEGAFGHLKRASDEKTVYGDHIPETLSYINHHDQSIESKHRRASIHLRNRLASTEYEQNFTTVRSILTGQAALENTVNDEKDMTPSDKYIPTKTKRASTTSPRRKRMSLKQWTSDFTDQHPSVLDGVGAALAFGRHHVENSGLSLTHYTNERYTSNASIQAKSNRDFRYKRLLERERNAYTPMEKILKEDSI